MFEVNRAEAIFMMIQAVGYIAIISGLIMLWYHNKNADFETND